MSVMPRRARASRKRGSARATSPTSVMSSIRMRGRTPGTCRQSTTLSATRSTRASQTWPLVRSKAQTNASRGNEAPAPEVSHDALVGLVQAHRFEHHARSEIVCRSHGRRRLAYFVGSQGIERMAGAALRQGLGVGIGHMVFLSTALSRSASQSATSPCSELGRSATNGVIAPQLPRRGADLRKQRLDPLRGSASSAAACPFPSPSCPIRCLA